MNPQAVQGNLGASNSRQQLLEKVLHKVDVGITPYLEIVDLRNAFVRIRSIEHPDEFVDIYKGSLKGLVDALLKSEAELNRVNLRAGLFNTPNARVSVEGTE